MARDIHIEDIRILLREYVRKSRHEELIQDTVAEMLQNGNEITWSYNEESGALTPTVTGGGAVSYGFAS